MIRAATWLVAALSCLAGVVVITIATPAQAGAATAYRYWAYYLGHSSTWQYAQRGPASEYPVDGDVEGWRFAIQTDAAGGLTPRDAPDFGTLCATTPAKTGEIRVGLVIDFGVASDAPTHESAPAGVVPGCVYVHAGDSGAAVLQAATTVRLGTGVDAGLVCGIDGYPKSECAIAVAVTQGGAPTPGPPPTTTPVAARTSASATVQPSASTTRPVPVAATAAASVSPASSAAPPIGGTSSVAAPASAATATPLAAAATPLAAATSLAALKTSGGGSSRTAVTAVLGGVLVVALGAAAVLRARRGRP